MPYGLCNIPAIFRRLMEEVLDGLSGKICMVYLDDILVMGRSLKNLTNLCLVFERLLDARPRLKPKKCFLIQPSEDLGYVVLEEGVAADPKKVNFDFPVPTNVKTLESFISLASYYQRFIPNFS